MAPNTEYQLSLHQKLAVLGPFLELDPDKHHHKGIRSGQMTYHLKALILAPKLGGLQWKMFGLDFFQHCGTTLYIIKGRVQKFKSAKVWSLTIEGGGRSKPNPYSDFKKDFKL